MNQQLNNLSSEILGFSETFDTILQEEGTQGNRDTECIPWFSFTKSEKLINLLSMSEGIGKVEFVFSETKAQQSGTKGKESSKVIAGNKGANVRDSPLETQVQTRRFRSVLSFGQKGESVGMLNDPWGVAVNDHDEIAVTECGNHRVSVFSSDGTHLRWFGWEGQNNGAFQFPSWIAFDSLGNIVVRPAPPPPRPLPLKKILYWQTVITTGCKSLIRMVTLLVGLVDLEVLITSLVTLKVYQ